MKFFGLGSILNARLILIMKRSHSKWHNLCFFRVIWMNPMFLIRKEYLEFQLLPDQSCHQKCQNKRLWIMQNMQSIDLLCQIYYIIVDGQDLNLATLSESWLEGSKGQVKCMWWLHGNAWKIMLIYHLTQGGSWNPIQMGWW